MFGKKRRFRRSRAELRIAVNNSTSESMELKPDEVGDAIDILTKKIKSDADRSIRKVRMALDELEGIEIPESNSEAV